MKIFMFGLLGFIGLFLVNAAVGAEARSMSSYRPDFVKLQTAGGIGLAAVGVGNTMFDDRLEVDIWYGFLPEAVGRIDIHTLALKLAYSPFGRLSKPDYEVRPVYFGMTVLHVIGDQYYAARYEETDSDYYPWTSFRAVPHLGIELGKKYLSFYAELGVVDAYAQAWYTNRDTIAFSQILNISFGTKWAF